MLRRTCVLEEREVCAATSAPPGPRTRIARTASEPTLSLGPEQEERIPLPLTLAESIGEGIVVIDRESRIRYVNEAPTRIFGYSRDEPLGSSLPQLMPERFRDEPRHSFGEYLVTGRRHVDWSEVELPGLHRAGSELSLRLSFTEFSQRGQRYFCGAIRDVTDAGASDNGRRTEARRYRVLFEENVAAVFRAGRDGRLLGVNEAFADLSGHDSPGELEGRNVTELFAEGGERAHLVRDIREHRDVRNRELELEARDEEGLWALVNAVWVEGPPEVLVGTVSDISDRKRAERELQLAEDRYRRLFEQSLVGVLRSRAEPRGQVLACNRVFAEMLGFEEPAGGVGRPASEFFAGGEERRRQALDRLREEGVLLQYGLELRCRDGSTIWVWAPRSSSRSWTAARSSRGSSSRSRIA